MTYFQLKIDGRNAEENYPDLQQGAAAYNTAVDVLSTAHSAPGTKVELFRVDGPPRQETALAAAVMAPGGSYDTILMHVKFEGGQYVITDENLIPEDAGFGHTNCSREEVGIHCDVCGEALMFNDPIAENGKIWCHENCYQGTQEGSGCH